jgi:hypothetical protein
MLLKKDAAIIAKAEVLYLEKKAEYTICLQEKKDKGF